MDALLRFLNRPVLLRPASPRAWRVLRLLLAGWVALNIADWATTAALLHGGSHEGNPFQAALLAHGGLVALAGYKALVIVGGGAC